MLFPVFNAGACAGSSATFTPLVESVVDLCYFRNPALALAVLQREDLLVRPMKVERHVRYLLVEPL